jgi:hypothetical protein
MLPIVWKKYRENVKARRVAIAILSFPLIVFGIFGEVVTTILPAEISIFAILGMLLVLLEIIQTKIFELEDITKRYFSPFQKNKDAYTELTEKVIDDPDTPGNVYLISYSGRSPSTMDVLDKAKNRDREVFLLVQHPSEMVSKSQRQNLRCGLLDHWYRREELKLNLRFYRERSSVRGLKIGYHIGLGWYTFRELESGDTTTTGHDNITTLYTYYDTDFAKVDGWFKNIFRNRWDSGSTLEDLVNESNEEITGWLEEIEETEDRKRNWIKKVSHNHPTGDELFGD